MTNEQRQTLIKEKFGNVVDSMVKNQGKGWKIVLKSDAKTLLQANGGKNEIVDTGLLECLNQLKRLVRQTSTTVAQPTKTAAANKIVAKK
jgi:hypothetical protein